MKKKTSKPAAKKTSGKKPVSKKPTSKTKTVKARPVDNLDHLLAKLGPEVVEIEDLSTLNVSVSGEITDKPVESNAQDKFLSKLKNDNVNVEARIIDLSELTGIKFRKGISKAIISGGEGVNIISPSYGFLPNNTYFGEVERAMNEAGIKYAHQSINKDNSDFAIDYILQDPSYHVEIKTGNDRILPMLRFTNSYSGGPVSGRFGFFREVCTNGLHIAETKVGFKVRHKSTVTDIAITGIKELVNQFMENEYYALRKKFEVLAEKPIANLNEFVKFVCTKTDLFKYEASEKNPDTPSKAAKIVIDTINREAGILGTTPNLWLGYNAFNESIHNTKKTFGKQRSLDMEIFDTVLEMAN